ncbi:DUF2087 domain-containing protein [Tumebacillus flagellatus]|uniref:HTH luxR-type domain-containing protein n=1 Tax=Tumebacillus flagellatus TaxID=1157490 RepID=A0A074LL13_9BACL|nr:DUF2087 domain-containing protein [Tumebacillus flagellatus]KEO81240.1 hypothetical protein EL26_21785 [Tumebacillus flagellatus]
MYDRGYRYEDEQYFCMFCEASSEQGVIYPEDGVLYDAQKAMKRHIEREHGSVLTALLGLGKKETGLTETQRTLLEYFAAGYSDAEIASKTGSSLSTVRNHRFALREKERQARVFLAIMGQLDSLAPPRTREAANREARVPSEFPAKGKKRQEALEEAIKRFQPGRFYTEAEVNELLGELYTDHVLVRRLLIEQGGLEREADGRAYWRKGETEMDKKAQMKWEYKNTRRPVGVYQVKCLANGKVYVGSSPNVDGMINRIKFELKTKMNRLPKLQADYDKYGADQFVFEVLELVKPESEGPQDTVAEGEQAKLLEAKWLEKLQPYGENGYNELEEEM